MSKDDCGINLGCEKKYDCATYCLKHVRNVLGSDEMVLSQKGKDELCKRIGLNEKIDYNNGMSLWVDWNYTGCGTGRKELILDLCCEKKCFCKLVGFDVKKVSENKPKILIDFTDNLKKKPLGYVCSLNEFDDCEKKCRNKIATDLKHPELNDYLEINSPNINIFSVDGENSDFASEFVCKEFKEPIKRPGMDIYIQIGTRETNNNFKYVELGHLCCRRTCRCNIYMQDALDVGSNNEKSILYENLTSYITDIRPEKYSFNCYNEIQDCMALCRYALGQYADSAYLKNNATAQYFLTSNINIFTEKFLTQKICDTLLKKISPPGLNFYLRPSIFEIESEQNFPFVEDMHMGRLCCDAKLISNITRYIPFNKCNLFPVD
jgi:hypothetical protein